MGAVAWVLDLVISQSASIVVVLKSGCEGVLCGLCIYCCTTDYARSTENSKFTWCTILTRDVFRVQPYLGTK